MNKNFYRIISFSLVLIWMIVIFCLSAMEGTESNYESRRIVNKIITVFSKKTNVTNANESNLNVKPQTREQLVRKVNTPFRKCMHATVYFILALLVYNFINTFEIKNYLKYLIPIIYVFFYACTDEYHQTFVSGRGGQFSDVLIDTAGGIISIFLIIIIRIMIKLVNSKRNVRKMST